MMKVLQDLQAVAAGDASRSTGWTFAIGVAALAAILWASMALGDYVVRH